MDIRNKRQSFCVTLSQEILVTRSQEFVRGLLLWSTGVCSEVENGDGKRINAVSRSSLEAGRKCGCSSWNSMCIRLYDCGDTNGYDS